MAKITKPRGTQDLLPRDIAKWHTIERAAIETAERFGFAEVRTPTFEHTELFQRGVGDTTDVVQKEMYTFEDKGGRSITLRPEGTAGVVRAALENGLLGEALPLKLCYFTNCFRYEKPQAGRLREFRQFGVEVFGAAAPDADAEVIALAHTLFARLGVKNLSLEINSIGCPDCRAVYHAALQKYFTAHADKLCATCNGRLERNPMRILDCKSPVCKEIAKDAPNMLDYLDDECAAHFEAVKARLTTLGISYTINPRIVRGLDYYTRTVFEFVSSDIGAQGTVCGGGRYDGLVSELGGNATPGLGFGLGLDRLILLMEAQGLDFMPAKACDLYIAPMGEAAKQKAAQLVYALRLEGFRAESDIMGRSLKAQMKYADKLGARFSMVIGDDELAKSTASVKNMSTGESTPLSLGDDFVEKLYAVMLEAELSDVTDAVEKFGSK